MKSRLQASATMVTVLVLRWIWCDGIPHPYRRFANERDRAFLDLTSRIAADAPRHVVDFGCGPGNLTGLLASRWPQAVIEGIDSSPEMIAAAAGVPGVSFSVSDGADWQPAGDVDVVVSNAALQRVPRHQEPMAKWASALPSGGWLAVQVPGNFDSPSHALMRSLADSARWSPALHTVVPHAGAVGAPQSYARLLLDTGVGRRRLGGDLPAPAAGRGPGAVVAARRGSAAAAGGAVTPRRPGVFVAARNPPARRLSTGAARHGVPGSPGLRRRPQTVIGDAGSSRNSYAM
jgi:trans-aconitate methyltransferase